jgi:hypothetical protein
VQDIGSDNKDRACEKIQEKEGILRLEGFLREKERERERRVIVEEIRGKREKKIIL